MELTVERGNEGTAIHMRLLSDMHTYNHKCTHVHTYKHTYIHTSFPFVKYIDKIIILC